MQDGTGLDPLMERKPADFMENSWDCQVFADSRLNSIGGPPHRLRESACKRIRPPSSATHFQISSADA